MAQQRGVVIEAQHRSSPPTAADRCGIESEMREALINLVFNAVDAMPDGGTLTLRTRVRDAGVARRRVHRSHRYRRRHGRRHAAPLPRAVLHHQGRARHRPGPGDGLRHGAAPRRRARDRQRAGQGHHVAADVLRRAAPARGGRAAGAPDRVPGRLRILLIDDDPLLLELAARRAGARRPRRDTRERRPGGHRCLRRRACARASRSRWSSPISACRTSTGARWRRPSRRRRPDTPVIMLTGWGQRLVGRGRSPPDVVVLCSASRRGSRSCARTSPSASGAARCKSRCICTDNH